MTRDEVKEKRKLARNQKTNENNTGCEDKASKNPESNYYLSRGARDQLQVDTEAEERKEYSDSNRSSSEEDIFLHFFKQKVSVVSDMRPSGPDYMSRPNNKEEEEKIFKLNRERILYGSISPSFREDLLNWRPNILKGFSFQIDPVQCLSSSDNKDSQHIQGPPSLCPTSKVTDNRLDKNLRVNFVCSSWKNQYLFKMENYWKTKKFNYVNHYNGLIEFN